MKSYQDFTSANFVFDRDHTSHTDKLIQQQPDISLFQVYLVCIHILNMPESDHSDSDSERRSRIKSSSDSEIIFNDLDKRLLYAAKVGVAEDVQSLIQEGANIHVVDDRSVIKSFIIYFLSSLPKGI